MENDLLCLDRGRKTHPLWVGPFPRQRIMNCYEWRKWTEPWHPCINSLPLTVGIMWRVILKHRELKYVLTPLNCFYLGHFITAIGNKTKAVGIECMTSSLINGSRRQSRHGAGLQLPRLILQRPTSATLAPYLILRVTLSEDQVFKHVNLWETVHI